jgi:hypothetical protein
VIAGPGSVGRGSAGFVHPAKINRKKRNSVNILFIVINWFRRFKGLFPYKTPKTTPF